MSNVRYDENVIASGVITGVYVPFWTRPGFVIPIVKRDPRSNATYAQVCDINGRIKGFVEINAPNGRFWPDLTPVNVGDDEIYAIVDHLDHVHLGNKTQIIENIIGHNLYQALQDRPLTLFAFANFCSDDPIVKKSLNDVLTDAVSRMGFSELTLEWFIKTTAYLSLRSAIANVSKTPIDECSLRIDVALKAKNVTIILETDHDVRFKIQDVTENGNIFEKVVRTILGVTSGTVIVRINDRKFETDAVDATSMIFSGNVMFIRSLPRQEQRYIRIIRTILDNFENGMSLVHTYRDGTKFVNRGLERLRELRPRLTEANTIDGEIATELLTMLMLCYPRLRPRLVLEIAKQIGHNEVIADTFRAYVVASRAKWVGVIRREVLNLLAQSGKDEDR